MTAKRSDSIDYTTQCTVCIDYVLSGVKDRIVYERPQMLVPDRRLTAAEAAQLAEFPNDAMLTSEAKWIFADMKNKGLISQSAELASVFVARSAAAALEMNL